MPASAFDQQSGEFLVENEVDHAGHGVGAVNRRGAAGDDLNPAHQHLRQRVDVDGAVLVRGRHTVAVQQHQGALRAEVAQRKRVAAIVGAAVALVRGVRPPMICGSLFSASAMSLGVVFAISAALTAVIGVGDFRLW